MSELLMHDQGVWWVALDVDYVRYREVKVRKVVAQGWPHLEDISDLVTLAADPDNREVFETSVRQLAADVYGERSVEVERAPGSLWRLTSLRKGDLVVAAEGTTVLGLGRLQVSGWESYVYDGKFSYAQTVGRGIQWHDWEYASMGPRPDAPRRLLGVKAVRSRRKAIVEGWGRWAKLTDPA